MKGEKKVEKIREKRSEKLEGEDYLKYSVLLIHP